MGIKGHNLKKSNTILLSNYPSIKNAYFFKWEEK